MNPLADAPRPEWWETLFFEGLPPLYSSLLLSGLLVASLVALWAFVLRNIGADEILTSRVPLCASEEGTEADQHDTSCASSGERRDGPRRAEKKNKTRILKSINVDSK